MERNRDSEEKRYRHPDALVLSYDDESPEVAEPREHEPERRHMPKAPRRGRGVFRKVVVFLLLAALLLAVAYVGYIVSIVAKISTNPVQFAGLSADAAGRTNILVLGEGDPGHAGEGLTDTMMVWSLDSPGKRMAQISIPRDLRVQIPGHGYGKINAANVYGGVTIAEQTVSNTLNLPIDYYVKTDFSGLQYLVDAVGGIDVDVKQRLADTEYPCDDNQYKSCGLVIEPGLQHMDGAQALKYVRCRKGTCGNDFGRAERQQEVLGLLRPKLTDWHLLLHPAQLKLIAAAAQKSVETDMGFVQLLQVGNLWRGAADNNPVHLVLSTAPGGLLKGDPSGSSDLLPVGGSFSAVAEAVQNIFSTESAASAQ